MGSFAGPEIVTDGLVFAYDMGNPLKSWIGAPATNLFTETNLNNWSKDAVVSTSQFITPFDTPSYIITDDNAAGWESINRSITVANDYSSHTISLMVRKTFGGTSARLGFNVSYSGGTAVYINARFNSDTGVTTNGLVIDYGDWWYWYFSITNNSTGNTSLNYNFYPATGVHNGSDNSTVTGTAIVGAFMLVAGSVAARFASGTRSTTQSLLDLARRTTITMTSPTYNSNGSFSFSGGTERITLPATIGPINNHFTMSAWINSTSISSTQNILSMNGPYFMRIDGSRVRFNVLTDTWLFQAGTTTLLSNTWYFLTMVWNGTAGTWTGYINGTQEFSTAKSGTVSATNFYGYVGYTPEGGEQSNFQGQIATVYYYNRALTAAEVIQNFNANRGRYGI
jgi:hypothetical protein